MYGLKTKQYLLATFSVAIKSPKNDFFSRFILQCRNSKIKQNKRRSTDWRAFAKRQRDENDK